MPNLLKAEGKIRITTIVDKTNWEGIIRFHKTCEKDFN